MGSLPTQKEFIKYIANLAVEGETALIVRQKLKGRSAELHADGVLKATWVPLMPSEMSKIKADWAIYGNTASFIKDRLTEKISASAANCEYVLCMVLDDIGTKSKEPPLDPTWKIETSPGSFQWGYTFSAQPTKGAFAAAIRAVADAGFTDPGACNAVRNFRLPGSVNLKPERAEFKAVILEFHPEREFTLDEICEALDVTPGEDIGAGLAPINIKRTDDEVLNWLKDNNYLLSGVNSEGWCGVVCPNHENHSTPEDIGARYNTNDRGFVCYHEHCIHITSQDFLDWVSEQGGPSVTHGFDQCMLADTLAPALAKLNPDPKLLEQAKKGIEDIEKNQASRVAKGDIFKRFAYIIADDSYFDLQTRREYPRSVFNALFRGVECKSMHSGRKIEASIFFDENRDAHKSPVLAAITYAPGETELVARKGDIYGNRWKDARPEVNLDVVIPDEGINMWLDHGRKLIPNRDELEHVLDVMAYKLQHPERKINHAILHAGREGCGKDTFWAPFMWAVCGPYADNRGYLDSSTLNSAWGYHLESEVLLINELREPTMSERQALANNLKPVIAAPPEFLDVNRKGLHPYKAVNRTFVLAFSNSRTPISLSPQDRRWFVIWSEAERMDKIDGDRYWTWYESGGFEAIASRLHQRDVSAFSPAATPMDTEYKQMLIDGGMSTAQSFLVHIIKEGIGEFQAGVIGSPFFKVADRLQGQAPAGVKVHHAGIIEALQDAGWNNLGLIMSKQNTTKKQIWVSPCRMEEFTSGAITRSELRNMAEEGAMPRIINIKKEA